jgi:hypothetical protein
MVVGCGIRYIDSALPYTSYIPLKKVEIRGTINDIFAKLCITQNYYNDSPNKLNDCTYFFELDESIGSTISENFVVFFSKTGRKITGEIKKKEIAKAEYETAKSEGKKTALFSDLGNGKYEIKIGNIDPNEFVSVYFAYNSVLKITNEGYKFAFPTSVAPRCDLSLFKSSDKFTSVGESADYDFDFDIKWTTGAKIICAVDNMAPFAILESENKCNIKMTKLPVDGNLSLTLKTNFSPAFYVSREIEGTVCSLVSLQIPDEKTENYKKDYIFLLDRSGSMAGVRIESAKRGLSMFIDVMKSNPKYAESSCFNIIGFGSKYDSMFPESIKATIENLDAAQKILSFWQANLGGTEILQPLQYIQTLKHQHEISERILILLTDGEVSNTDAVVNYIGSMKNTRTFTIGIGKDVNRNLIHKCAEAGNGLAVCVHDVIDLPQKILEILDICAKLYYTNVVTKYYDSDGNILKHIMSVQKDNTIYPNKYFMNISLFNVDDFEKIKRVCVVGIKQDGTYEKNTWTVDIVDSSEAEVIDDLFQIFVKEAINADLFTKDQKIDMCIKHTVLCDLVSMIAVDHESSSSLEKGVDVVVENHCSDSILRTKQYDSRDVKKKMFVVKAGKHGRAKCIPFPDSYPYGTSSSSLKNKSWDIRGAPANPKVIVCPWNNSNIDFDILGNDEIKKLSVLEGIEGIDNLYIGAEPRKRGLIDPRLGNTSIKSLIPVDFKCDSDMSLEKYADENLLSKFITTEHGIIKKREALLEIGIAEDQIVEILKSDVKFYETIINYLKKLNDKSFTLNALYYYLNKLAICYSSI